MTPPPPSDTVSDDLDADLALALRLADAADAETAPRFDQAHLEVSLKADRTHVTEADLAAERAIRALIQAERPDDAIYGEEFGATEGRRRWVIDPIDGTANYLRGVPAWGTMIALVIDGTPRLGVVSSPALGRRWWAAAGRGAWVSVAGAAPHSIHVSGIDTLDEASISFQSISQWDRGGHADKLLPLSRRVWRDRAYGDIWSYMLLAEGRLEFVAEFDVKEYDIAAAAAIVTEAGGRFTSFDGVDTLSAGSALATNGLLHDAFLDQLHGTSA
ncbi:MAG: inositol monophosphatase family protein [Microbacterium sp.]